jgi:hypothetical protein
MLLPLSLMPALFVWHWPELEVLPALIGMGVCAVLGHVCVVRGYAATDASLAMTFEFSKLSFAVGIAYLAFGEVIDAWTWVGAVIIFASAVYITRREARLRGSGRPPATVVEVAGLHRENAAGRLREPTEAPQRCPGDRPHTLGKAHLERHTWKGTLGKALADGLGAQAARRRLTSANERNGSERMTCTHWLAATAGALGLA